MHLRGVIVASVVLFSCLSYRVAVADETPAARAKAHNARAKKLFTLGQFKEAAEQYKQAYKARVVPEFLFNIGQCYKRMGSVEDLEQALFYFESYRNSVKSEQNRRVAEEEIADLGPRIKKLRQERDRPEAVKQPPILQTEPGVQEPVVRQSEPEITRPAKVAGRPFYKTWWFWSVVGAVVVGSTAAIAATTGGDDWVPTGTEYTPDTYDPGSQ